MALTTEANGYSQAPMASGTASVALQRNPVTGLVNQWHSQPRKLRIIHVGAGATGLCTAYKMRNQLENYELVCYEKNSSIGGTWFESNCLFETVSELGIALLLTLFGRSVPWLCLRRVGTSVCF